MSIKIRTTLHCDVDSPRPCGWYVYGDSPEEARAEAVDRDWLVDVAGRDFCARHRDRGEVPHAD